MSSHILNMSWHHQSVKFFLTETMYVIKVLLAKFLLDYLIKVFEFKMENSASYTFMRNDLNLVKTKGSMSSRNTIFAIINPTHLCVTYKTI